jgi:hypothetical protein
MLPEVQITGPPALQYGTSPNRIALHSAVCLEMPLPYSVGGANTHLRPRSSSTLPVHNPPPFHDIASDLSHSFRKASRQCCVPFNKKNTYLSSSPLSFPHSNLDTCSLWKGKKTASCKPHPHLKLNYYTIQTMHVFATLAFQGKEQARKYKCKGKGKKGGSEYVSKSWLISPLWFFFFW